MIELLKRQKGITLIALVITIIVLIILAAVSISMLTGENGILTKANEAKEAMERANILEQIQIKVFEKQATLYRTQITKEDMEGILEQYGTIIYEADGTTIKGITTSKGNYEILLTEVYQGTLVAGVETPTGPTTDGSWNGTINTPKLMTGMTAIAWDSSKNEITPTTNEQWYDYTTNKWANAVTKDSSGNITGYYVWIPRYEYSISGTTVNVKFIQTTQTTVDGGYTYIHPAFRNGSSNNFKNGEWDAEIGGFWVAKYPAGFQASTIDTSGNLTNGSDTVQYSNLNYINNTFTANAIGQNLTTLPKMSYPVFKPQTYAYNCISTGDIYRISQDIKNASSFYGLNSSQTDTHMMKNSEWGAVAYLTQSTYGRNGTEPNINNLNLSNKDSKYIYAVTGFAGAGTSTAAVTTVSGANGYKTATGELGSSTGNITGVYDLNGCVWEYTAGYITNGNTSLSTYGSSYAATTANLNGYLTNSTKYATAYPYNSSSDTQPNNWTAYNNLKSSSYGYGDAILETSTSGASPYTNSWNSDYSSFPTTSTPFFLRGGNCAFGSNAGPFAFITFAGHSGGYYGSRLVLLAL